MRHSTPLPSGAAPFSCVLSSHSFVAPGVKSAVTFLSCLRDVSRSLSVSVSEMRQCHVSQCPERTRGSCDFPESGCTVSLREDLQVGNGPHLDLDPLIRTCPEVESTASFRRGLAGRTAREPGPLRLPLPSSCPDRLLGWAPGRGQVL